MSSGGPLGAVRRWLVSVRPHREHLRADLIAGLPNAIERGPRRHGVRRARRASTRSPGLYASFAGPIAGGLGTSTRLMVITTTSAAALAAGSGVVEHRRRRPRPARSPCSPLLAGLLMVVAGIAQLGRYTRFVSHSVMLGFLSGIAVNIILGQLPDLTGAPPTSGSKPVPRRSTWSLHPGGIDLGVARRRPRRPGCCSSSWRARRLAIVSALVALVVPDDRGRRRRARQRRPGRATAGAIPKGLPLPALPDFGQFSLSLVTGAAAVAAIVLVQGAGVAESAPNADGPSNPNQDFVAQGAGNVVAGFFRGHAGRRLGRLDGAERDRGRPHPLGGDLLRRLDGRSSSSPSPASSARWPCRRWPPS